MKRAIDHWGRNFLLCEPNRADAETTALILKRMHINVEWINDGRECVTRFADSPVGYFQCIFMTISMPSLNGYQTAEEIRQFARPDSLSIPIIGLTTACCEIDLQKAYLAGVDTHIAKPVDSQVVRSSLQAILSDCPKPWQNPNYTAMAVLHRWICNKK